MWLIRLEYPLAYRLMGGIALRHDGQAYLPLTDMWYASAMDEQRRLLLTCDQSPGDVVMLTAAVRDLHRAHPGKFLTDVATTCMPIWESNPNITSLDWKHEDGQFILHDETIELIVTQYPMVHRSNRHAYHFVHGFTDYIEQVLGVRIHVTDMKGDIYLSPTERIWTNQVEQQFGYAGPFWVINAGGKFDFTAKWWDPSRYQAVVEAFQGRIQFVQVGEEGHWHQPLNGVIDMLGKTDSRQLIRLIHHSVGVLTPVSFPMHLAAAVPTTGSPHNRACVVVAGGREPAQWEAYPHHRFLATNGALMCCDNGGCWKSRCQPVGDEDEKDMPENLCPYPVAVAEDLVIPKCLDMITVDDVVRNIEMYYDGGALAYN